MEILNKYPHLKNIFDFMAETRCDEIFSDMLTSDNEYITLCNERAEASMVLKNTLVDTPADDLFEKYSDKRYRQEIYEIDYIYRQAFCDAVTVLEQHGLLKLNGLICEENT